MTLVIFALILLMAAAFDISTTVEAVRIVPGAHEANPLFRDSKGKFTLWRIIPLKLFVIVWLIGGVALLKPDYKALDIPVAIIALTSIVPGTWNLYKILTARVVNQ